MKYGTLLLQILPTNLAVFSSAAGHASTSFCAHEEARAPLEAGPPALERSGRAIPCAE